MSKDNTKEKFCKVPNELVWRIHSPSGNSLISKHRQQELVLLHTQLMLLRNMWHEIRFSIAHLCSMMDLPKRSSSYILIKKCLEIFQKENYFAGELVEWDNVNINDQITLLYEPFEIEDESEVLYFPIHYSILYQLMSLSKTKRDNYHALNLYSYFSARLYRNQQGYSYTVTGNYEVCFPTFEEIRKDIKQGNKTIVDNMKLLQDKELIYYENAGYYMDEDNKIKQARNTISLATQEDYKKQVKYSVKYYKEKSEIDFFEKKKDKSKNEV